MKTRGPQALEVGGITHVHTVLPTRLTGLMSPSMIKSALKKKKKMKNYNHTSRFGVFSFAQLTAFLAGTRTIEISGKNKKRKIERKNRHTHRPQPGPK